MSTIDRDGALGVVHAVLRLAVADAAHYRLADAEAFLDAMGPWKAKATTIVPPKRPGRTVRWLCEHRPRLADVAAIARASGSDERTVARALTTLVNAGVIAIAYQYPTAIIRWADEAAVAQMEMPL